MRNSPARDIPANSHNDANVPRQKSTGKFPNNNNDHHPKEMVDELSFHLRNMSDNNVPPQLDDIDSPTDDDAPQRDSFTSRMFFDNASTSHQMSPLTRSPWASYVERSPTDFSDANSNYTGLMASLIWRVSGETGDVERQQPQSSSSRTSGQMFSRMRELAIANSNEFVNCGVRHHGYGCKLANKEASKQNNFIDDDESRCEEINHAAFETKVSDEFVEDDVHPEFM
ncbi:hypothetical protein L1987_74911 [Smallanthus sonchifolius]|uniref:Uncharacterized protein n=1 Tax=Smallanthus sonchifolius TaxID=185202 RepID=A0ACB9A392_9ASTR|nr:hypothetical protein L1987_74911 [Smallanthus sonchifolius]